MMWKMIEDCSMIHFCSAESQTDINLGKVNSLYYFSDAIIMVFPVISKYTNGFVVCYWVGV